MANEKRLIDAYKLEDMLRSNSAGYHHKDDVIAAIAGQPTVDAVEVVRCKDCEWAKPYDRGDERTGYYCQHPNSTFCMGRIGKGFLNLSENQMISVPTEKGERENEQRRQTENQTDA